MKRLLNFSVFVYYLLFALTTFAQNETAKTNPWQFTAEPTLQSEDQERQLFPEIYQTAKVDFIQLQNILETAPERFSPESYSEPITMTLPMPDGGFEEFYIQEASIMHPDLQAKYPNIRSYSGQGIDDPTASIRFDISHKGFHAMIRSGTRNTMYIDPYASNNTEDYLLYFRKDYAKKESHNFTCSFHDHNSRNDLPALKPDDIAEAGDCDLRTFRLALACTGEYAQYHGGTVADVMAAFNTTMTRVIGIFENDAAITMQLVPNNDNLIFLNSSTDPYTNSDGGVMLGENQTTCDNIIGTANYDIGHVFSTGGGGIAYLQSPCNGNLKAGGVTGQSNPIGDPFDVDFVAHEMGHQYGANHTQNNSCNRNGSTAMEPGSASTIMGYAGVCNPNVQNNSDAYFHGISLQEIGNFMISSNSNCAVTTNISNNPPTVNGGNDYTIPGGTYFSLTAIGNDPDGSAGLTYCWEQFDNEVGNMPPSPSNSVGPMFRSLPPDASPTRYFPKIDDIVNNNSTTWEVLPAVDRSMEFRVTIRDNAMGGGCTDEDNVVVTVDGDSGPFLVTAPNTNVTWPAGSTQMVTWDVAGTTSAPVNAANVDILLSLDGGYTYPVTILANTPNDGSQAISVPNNLTTTARIMVKGSGNIFFDISNQNFTIDSQTDDFFIAINSVDQSVCQPSAASYTVDVTKTGNFNGNVTLSTNGLPAGLNASFSVNPVSVPGSSILTINNTNAVAAGVYSFNINANGSTGTKAIAATLTIEAPAPSVVLNTPTNNATNVSVTPTLSWSAVGNNTYDVQVATDVGFGNVIVNDNTSSSTYQIATELNVNTTYYWRVRATNNCGTGAYSTAFSFTTANIICDTYISTDVPVSIPNNSATTVSSTLTINDSGNISDLNINNLTISHTYVNDLIITLTSPAGTSVTVLNSMCNNENNVDINFDDESSNSYNSIPCPPVGGGTYQGENALSAFDGEDLNGTWTLTIEDGFPEDGGSLNSWQLGICYEGVPVTPISVTTSVTDATCNGNADGAATASATGGSGSYNYNWSNGENTPTITGLTAGTYTVVVSDGISSTTAAVTVGEPAAFSVTVSSTDDTDGGNGSATAIPDGGFGPYTYTWSNGDNTATINNLTAGTYLVTVTDNNNCTAQGSAIVEEVIDYCAASGNFSDYEWIENVTIGDINNTSGNDGGYGDYTNLSTDLEQNSVIALSFSPGFSVRPFLQTWVVYIDYNQDMDFDDLGEMTFGPVTSNTTISDLLVIPEDALLGNTRMRIVMSLYGTTASPCGTFGFGEVEDYTVNIVENSNNGDGCVNTIVDDTSFENGYGIWNDGGSDCRWHYSDAPYANTGDYCIRLRDNTSSSVLTTDVLDLSSFYDLTVSFSYITRSMDFSAEDFWLQLSYDGGASYTTVEEWNQGDEFENNQRKNDAVTIQTTLTIQGEFSNNMRIRFRCDAGNDLDWVYLDDIVISGCSYNVDAMVISGGIVSEEIQTPLSANIDGMEVSVFPNPVTNQLNVVYETANPGTTYFNIINAKGQLMRQWEQEDPTGGQHQINVDMSDFETGFYFLQVVSDGERKIKKVLKR